MHPRVILCFPSKFHKFAYPIENFCCFVYHSPMRRRAARAKVGLALLPQQLRISRIEEIMESERLPYVTAMIVVRNEVRYIQKCFYSLLSQTYPASHYEILILDGLSDDGTLELAKETESAYRAEHAECPAVRYFTNEKKILAAGWNQGIRAARGEYVVRIDAHGYADSDFIEKSVETILRVSDAACVGGAMRTESVSSKGELISKVLSSPFGVGNSKFRYSQKEEYVDTVAFGLYRKSIFEQAGYFDETMKRNQDNDMHRRIREAGGRFYLNPQIKTAYYSRDSVKGMLRQGYQNGKWNIIAFRKSSASLSMRHLVPLLFLCALILGAGLGFVHPVFWYLAVGAVVLHLILGVFFAARTTQKFTHFLAFPWLCLALHLCYGMGSLLEIFHIKRK